MGLKLEGRIGYYERGRESGPIREGRVDQHLGHHPRNLQMLTLGPHPRPTESETVGWAEQSALTSSPGDCVHGKGGRPLEKEAFGVWSQVLLLSST